MPLLLRNLWSRRFLVLAPIGLLLSVSSGCTLWNPDRWNLDRFRDERALEVEQHLSQTKPKVESPF